MTGRYPVRSIAHNRTNIEEHDEHYPHSRPGGGGLPSSAPACWPPMPTQPASGRKKKSPSSTISRPELSHRADGARVRAQHRKDPRQARRHQGRAWWRRTTRSAELARSAPDGYTMGLVGSSSAPHRAAHGGPAVQALGGLRPDRADRRAALWHRARKDSPIKSIDDIVKLSKQKRLTYSSTSPNNVLPMFQMAKLNGANLRWIVFSGGSESVSRPWAATWT